MEIFEFEIPGHSARREWAVYVIVATHIISQEKILYVGKVGDNREGCNPIISRIGNHLSHTKLHSQFRNRVEDTSKLNYRILYAVFGKYIKEKHADERTRINEIERRLNLSIQSLLTEKGQSLSMLKNPYKGKYVSTIQKELRRKLLTTREIFKIEKLARQALA